MAEGSGDGGGRAGSDGGWPHRGEVRLVERVAASAGEGPDGAETAAGFLPNVGGEDGQIRILPSDHAVSGRGVCGVERAGGVDAL